MWHWDAAKIAIVRSLWPTHSASVIAIRIGQIFGVPCTRMSIIGIAYRLKLKKGAGRHPPHELAQRRPKRATVIKTKPEWKPRPEIYRGPRVSGIQCPCQVAELEQYNCRWPYGDPRENGFYFCGAVVLPEGPYCPTHTRLAVNK